MIIDEYKVVQPDDTPVGKVLREMASGSNAGRFRVERLLRALEAFVQRDTRYSCRVLPEEEGKIEIYIEPSRYVLNHLPDTAALVRVDHGKNTIELLHIFEDYGGAGERAQWKEALRLARAALNDG